MRESNKDYVGAIFLIFLGIMFLLNTTGLVEWGMWLEILRFWPIFLIFAGIKLILPKGKLGDIILTVLAFLIFSYIALTIYFSSSNSQSEIRKYFISPTRTIENDLEIEEIIEIEDNEDIESIKYDFNFGVSEFYISDSQENFLKLNASYSDKYGKPIVDSQLIESIKEIKVTEEQSSFNFFNFNLSTPKYDVLIYPDMQSDLIISNGVGEGELNLNKAQLNKVDISTGTGKIAITLSDESIPSESMSISTGTGEVILNLPENVGYILDYSVGVGEIEVDGEKLGGIGKDGEDVKSENYDLAEKILVLEISTGVGSIKINFLNN